MNSPQDPTGRDLMPPTAASGTERQRCAQDGCGTPPELVRSTGYCSAHDPELREQMQEARARGGAATRKPSALELLRERVEAEADTILRAHFDALQAERTIVARNGDVVGTEADHALRLRAAEALIDRIYGRPKQQAEITGHEGGPLVVTLADIARQLAAEQDSTPSQEETQ